MEISKFFLFSFIFIFLTGGFILTVNANSNVANLVPDVFNYFIEVSQGNIPGQTSLHKFGHSETIGTTITDVWNGGTLYPWLLNATLLNLSSTDVDDTSGGTGGRIVQVFGLDENYTEIVENITLNGQTPVPTTLEYLRINRMILMTAGSTTYNEGNIHLGTGAVISGVPTTTYAEILFTNKGKGEGQTLMAIYTVPAGVTAYLVGMSFSTPQAKSAEVWLKIRPFGEAWQSKFRSMVISNSIVYDETVPIVIPEKSDVRLSGATSTGNTDLAGGFELVLIDN